MTRNYELTFIVKPDVDAANLPTLLERVKEYITAEGGSIVKLDQWGLRRLMYPIRKYREGQYVFALVQLEAPSIIRIENRLRLTEEIIRYLLIRADDEISPAGAEAASAETASAEATEATQGASTETPPEPVASAAPVSTAEATPENTTTTTTP